MKILSFTVKHQKLCFHKKQEKKLPIKIRIFHHHNDKKIREMREKKSHTKQKEANCFMSIFHIQSVVL